MQTKKDFFSLLLISILLFLFLFLLLLFLLYARPSHFFMYSIRNYMKLSSEYLPQSTSPTSFANAVMRDSLTRETSTILLRTKLILICRFLNAKCFFFAHICARTCVPIVLAPSLTSARGKSPIAH